MYRHLHMTPTTDFQGGGQKIQVRHQDQTLNLLHDIRIQRPLDQLLGQVKREEAFDMKHLRRLQLPLHLQMAPDLGSRYAVSRESTSRDQFHLQLRLRLEKAVRLC